MVQINFAKRLIELKLVYYGPEESGKTTNLERIHADLETSSVEEIASTDDDGDLTLSFACVPKSAATVGGMTVQVRLVTVRGAATYNATRKLALQGADGVVFVADSRRDRQEINLELLRNLDENLREHGLKPEEVPRVLQWNKRDLPDAVAVEELSAALNAYESPTFEANATEGQGVLETFEELSKLVVNKLGREYGLEPKPRGNADPLLVPAGGPPEGKRLTTPGNPFPRPVAKPDPRPEPRPKPKPKQPEPKPKPVQERRPFSNILVSADPRGGGRYEEPTPLWKKLLVGAVILTAAGYAAWRFGWLPESIAQHL